MRSLNAIWILIGLTTASCLLSGCGYNSIQQKDENAKGAWSEVLNQYQRRADLVPNLVATVKGYAAHEEEVLTKVTTARSQISSLNLSADMLEDEGAMTRFHAAQGELSNALSRLMAITENYPQLKADGLFQNLQTQLEGTENRIAVARGRYVQTVQEYNIYVRSFPQNLTAKFFGYKIKANFAVDDEKALSMPPPVDFSKPASQEH